METGKLRICFRGGGIVLAERLNVMGEGERKSEFSLYH